MIEMKEPGPLSQFSGRRYINLESYKKNGEPRLTPVQSIMVEGLVYLRTNPDSWKVKRIRWNPHVRIVPSDRNGKPTGKWMEGEARVLDGEEGDRAKKLFEKEYGAVGNSLIKAVARLRGGSLNTVISITPRPQSDYS